MKPANKTKEHTRLETNAPRAEPRNLSMAPSTPIGVVTVADCASPGEYEDKGGPAIEAAVARILP